MLTRLLVLWLLSEEPLHGYRIKKILATKRCGFWFPVEYASIYSVLRTLVNGGLRRGRSRSSGRDSARSGRVQDHARGAGGTCAELLRRAWRELPSAATPSTLALAARSELDEDGACGSCSTSAATRCARGSRELERLRAGGARAEMVDRQRALTLGELAWLGHREATTMTEKQPDVQLIANLVVRDEDGRVLLVRYDPDDERWWLPGRDVAPYKHPDEAAGRCPRRVPRARRRARSRRWRSSTRSAAGAAGT